jgi:tetratricopeptide (TPR) repeat protein
LEAQFPDTVETQPELLAQHYTEAGLHEQAVIYWQLAGQRARQRSAYVEVIQHVTQGLALIEMLPKTPEHLQQALTLSITLGNALSVTKGMAAPEVEQAYTQARALCQQVGETPQRFRALYGLWSFYNGRAMHRPAQDLGEQLLRLARAQQEPRALLTAHWALGGTLFFLGELVSAHMYLTQGLALPGAQQARVIGFSILLYEAWALWILGYPEQAKTTMTEALTRAQTSADPFSVVIILAHAALLHLWLQEWQTVQQYAERVRALSTEQDFANWLALGTLIRGWALAAQGYGDDGITHMRQGVGQYRAGAQVGLPHHLIPLAETYGNNGQPMEGLAVLAEALELMEATSERVWEAELYRLKGEILQQVVCGVQQEEITPEECLQQALAVARRQQAKSWELRAAISLARLWQRQGKRDAARQLLADVYSWFTEGLDTADLQEAKTLLEELS